MTPFGFLLTALARCSRATDVPLCNSTDPSECTYTITSNFTAGDMGGCANGCSFITMEGHW
jgi:hypothetical protein